MIYIKLPDPHSVDEALKTFPKIILDRGVIVSGIFRQHELLNIPISQRRFYFVIRKPKNRMIKGTGEVLKIMAITLLWKSYLEDDTCQKD